MFRIVEIVEHNRHLSLSYGSMQIHSGDGQLLGSIDLDEVLGVVCYPHGATVSAALMSDLSARSIPLVVSDHKFQPTGILLPVVGNFEQSARIEAQITASTPLKKQIWASIVRQKILMQALALEITGKNSGMLTSLARQVKSGDSSNVEAHAAKYYWSRFFDPSFRRNRDEPGINALLNYGYSIIRASVARSVTSAGLNPSIGLFHRNSYNGLRLVDDLMEPFRPLVDLRVHALYLDGQLEVTPDTKRELVDVLSTDVPSARGITPVANATQYAATSLVKVLRRETKGIEFPDIAERELFADFHQCGARGEK
jgi:CRISP-associated protein Cas1